MRRFNALSIVNNHVPDLSEDQIRADNTHFGDDLHVIYEESGEYTGQGADSKYSHYLTIASADSHIFGLGIKGEAYATYLWNTETQKWILGGN